MRAPGLQCLPVPFRQGRVARALLCAAFAFATVCFAGDAQAYPWMIRHSYGGCLTCHADPSGGELLTQYGRAQGDLLLRMRYGKDDVSGATSHGEGASENFDSFDSFDTESSDGGDATTEAAAETGDGPADSENTPGPKAKPKEDEDAEEEDEEGEDEEEEPKPKKGSGREVAVPFRVVAADAAAVEAEDDAGPGSGFLWGLVQTPDWLLLGGSYRHLNIYQFGEEDPFDTFPMQLDLYGQLQVGVFRAGGSIGGARVKPASRHARKAQVTTNQGYDWNVISRTHWVGAQFGDGGEYFVRAGRLNLPFGLRIPEHTSWVREATRTDRESDQQHGVAFAYSGADFRAEVMAIAGNYQLNPDRFRERGYSFYIEGLLSPTAAIGLSSMITHAEADVDTLREVSTNREAHGAFTRVALVKPLVLMAELDMLQRTDRKTGYVGWVQADYELVQGLHFMLTGEVLDQGRSTLETPTGEEISAPGAGDPRLGGALTIDWFFLPQLEARFDAVVRQEDPFTLLAQLHIYL